MKTCVTYTQFYLSHKNEFVKDIKKDVKRRFDTLNYEVKRRLMSRNENNLGMMKDKFGGTIIKKSAGYVQRCIHV